MMTVKVDGLKEIDLALAQLPRATAKAVARRILKRAAEPMRATAAALAPDDPATPDPDLNSSIIISSRRKVGRSRQREGEGSTVKVYVGPSADVGAKAAAQEFGTPAHNIAIGARKQGRGKDRSKRVVMHPGHAPQPYMRPAFEENVDRAWRIIAADTAAEIAKAVERRARKLAKRQA